LARTSSANAHTGRVTLLGATRSFIRFWGWGVGGSLLLVIVLMTAYSASANFFFRRPFAGDFEITQYGMAIAAFCFLPLAQLARANVMVDIFTMRAGPRAIMAMELLGSVIAFVFAAVLLWRMSLGMLDYYRQSEYTAILGIPLWSAYPPILISLFLLLIASVITAAETLKLIPSPPPDASKPIGAE
jgi:TRAP-type C4-dicarboxylate transport system permease small subunit